jgi:ribulose-5-phosphate 4-epimerase/fuculose-1-phosphate aldolase
MPNVRDAACYELALANRIVAHEGVLDGFGHISIRHPSDPARYLLARSRSPELVEPSDMLEFSLDLKPLMGLGATMGATVPFWDSRDAFGDTPMVVTTPEQGQSLARALGPHAMVLMRRHGATVVGATLQETVFRTIFSHRNAELQLRARALGEISPLTAGEAELAESYSLRARPMGRAWEYWTTRLAKAGELPPRPHPLAGEGIGGGQTS